jgi:hypothetical protein
MTILDQMQPGNAFDSSWLMHMHPGLATAPEVALAAGVPSWDGVAFVPVPGQRGEPGSVAGTLSWDQITDRPALTFVQQFSSASVVVVPHGMGRYPGVTVLDSAGGQWETDVEYDSTMQLTIRMSAPFAGRVICH